MALTLPYPSLSFVPLDVLTAEEMNEIVANYTYIANQFPIATSNLANGSVTNAKIDWSTVQNSTTEHVVGKWRDGSTIYERSFTGNITSIAANTTKVWDVDSSVSYKAAISADGWVQWTSTNFSMIGGTTLYDSSGNIIFAGIAISNGVLQIRCCFTQAASSVPYEISVRYLKTS